MPTPTFLAELSDRLIYSAIAVYALAMLTYACQAARRSPAVAHDVRQMEHVAAGAHTGRNASSPPRTVVDRATTEGAATQRLERIAAALTMLAFVLHLAGVLTRGLAAGRAPWGNMYEFTAAATLAATAAYLAFLRRQPVRDLGVWILALVTLCLGLAVTVLYTPAGDLVPALNSYWLVIHVAAAIIAGGVFTVGAAATGLYLLRRRADARDTSGQATRGYAGRLPAGATLERVAHTAHLFAFPVWTFAVLAGAIWAEDSWGRYWGWDPKETWAFITWVLYAAYLHAQSTAGWRGRKAAWLALAGYAAFLFNFVGVNLFITGLHSYAGV
ncbi:c-type cytochrome biogenesis protein CcsB [Actinotalea ferrariae]|uniref:c-type cytochrome biogenesis protein CcsB n=1 Tax=Actinotalea ferrariae TaxID=1386098 RepID=UPI001C8BF067|nr:c-type cytochrome biogenesis protein CcsB [Actinotalea ferrariae]MBX9243620.1 c-type cytochrome biogenesis protein CcsB [Actinotalea ferrariae]